MQVGGRTAGRWESGGTATVRRDVHRREERAAEVQGEGSGERIEGNLRLVK